MFFFSFERPRLISMVFDRKKKDLNRYRCARSIRSSRNHWFSHPHPFEMTNWNDFLFISKINQKNCGKFVDLFSVRKSQLGVTTSKGKGLKKKNDRSYWCFFDENDWNLQNKRELNEKDKKEKKRKEKFESTSTFFLGFDDRDQSRVWICFCFCCWFTIKMLMILSNEIR